MQRKALATLHRIRTEASEAAQRALAEALANEAELCRLAGDADLQIAAEAQAALDLAADDGAVEAYLRWLPGAQAVARRLHAEAEAAAAKVAAARATVSLSRTAEASIDRALEAHDASERQARSAKEQLAIDEIAQRASGSGGAGHDIAPY